MKTVRNIVFIVLGLLVLGVLVSFFLPSEMFVERSIHINASQEAVFNEVSNLRRFNNWSPWAKEDTEAKYSYAGPEQGVGAEMSWDGKKVGQGRMVIVGAVPPDSVLTELYFYEENKANHANFYLSEAGADGTKLTWMFRSELGLNPIGRYMGLIMSPKIDEMYLAGLQALKDMVESFVPPPIEEVLLEAPRRLIGVRSSFNSPEEAGAAMEKTFGQVAATLQAHNISPSTYASMYFVQPESDATGSIGYIAGILAEESASLPESFVQYGIPAGMYLRATHVGSYEQLGETHTALRKTLSARNYVPNGNAWETYTVHPGIEPDTAKWETHVYYPVQKPSMYKNQN